MSSPAAESYLKDRIRLKKQAVLLVGALLLTWVSFRTPISFAALGGLDHQTAGMSVLPSLLAIAVTLIDSLPGTRLKAILVFWRIQNPFPGSRAFEKSNLDSDGRIDKPQLRARVGGAFPRSPAEQDKTWFRLYRLFEKDVRVEGLHAETLLLRDLTWFAVVFVLAALASMLLNRDAWKGLAVFAGMGAMLYLLLARAASERWCRFVNTVLSLASTTPEQKQGQLP